MRNNPQSKTVEVDEAISETLKYATYKKGGPKHKVI